MKGLFVYFKLFHFTASTYSQYVWNDLLNIDFGEPLTACGTSVFDCVIKKRKDFFYNNKGHLTGQCLTSKLCFPEMEYSKYIRLFDIKLQKDLSNANIEEYDYIIVAAFNGYYQYINWIIKNYPKIPVIIIQDDAVEEIQYSHTSLQIEMLNAIRNTDGFISYQKEMLDMVKMHSNSLLIHHPMNPDFNPITDQSKEDNLICIGVGCWNYDFMNLFTALSALGQLRKNSNLDIKAEFLGVHDYQRDKYDKIFELEDVKIKDWSKHGEYYNNLKRYSLIFNLNGRAVAGRVSAEAALVGTPVIGNVLADMQEYCWPYLSVHKYNAYEVYKLSNKILGNDDFRKNQIDLAKKKINLLKNDFYNTGNKLENFINIVIKNKK